MIVWHSTDPGDFVQTEYPYIILADIQPPSDRKRLKWFCTYPF